MTWRLTVIAAGLASGCGSGSEYGAEDHLRWALPRLPPSACVRPIAEYCARRPCPTYDEQVRQLESWATQSCASLLQLVIGTCGDLRYTSASQAFGGETHYYDAAGMIVAAHSWDDVPAFSGCDVGPFGFIPDCNEKVTRDLCPR